MTEGIDGYSQNEELDQQRTRTGKSRLAILGVRLFIQYLKITLNRSDIHKLRLRATLVNNLRVGQLPVGQKIRTLEALPQTDPTKYTFYNRAFTLTFKVHRYYGSCAVNSPFKFRTSSKVLNTNEVVYVMCANSNYGAVFKISIKVKF